MMFIWWLCFLTVEWQKLTGRYDNGLQKLYDFDPKSTEQSD